MSNLGVCLYLFLSNLDWNGNFTTKFISSSRLVLLNRGKIKASRNGRGFPWSWEAKMRCVWFSSTDKARLISRHGLLFPTAIACLRSCILSPDSFILGICDAFPQFLSQFRTLSSSQNPLHPRVSSNSISFFWKFGQRVVSNEISLCAMIFILD